MTQSATKLVPLVCFSLFLTPLCVRPVHAQAIHEGKLTGTVTQEDGAVLPGATVDISGPQLLGGKRSAVTSGDGTYLFLNVPKGVYVVTTGLAGFKTIVRDNVLPPRRIGVRAFAAIARRNNGYRSDAKIGRLQVGANQKLMIEVFDLILVILDARRKHREFQPGVVRPRIAPFAGRRTF